MSESMESRKFDRKQVFDVPLPMRRNVQGGQAAPNSEGEDQKYVPPPVDPNTMKFALLSRRGNKQQVCRSPDLEHN